MAVKKFRPITPARRYLTVADFADISSNRNNPEKGLIAKKSRSGGRNHFGRATNINKGGGHKKRYRVVDFKLDKIGMAAKVVSIEYDPNRSGRIALVQYADGERRYILAPAGLEVGREIMIGPDADIKPGNALPLKNIPTGQEIYNIALQNGGAAALVRSAGAYAQLVAKEGEYVSIRLPSGEVRKVLATCYASIGAVSNAEHKNIIIGKAGRSRWLGRRPHNRGVTKNPVDHPMGGGEGKSKGGRHPVSPTGIIAKGKKTRKNKRTQKFIVRSRGKGKSAS